MNIKRSKAVSGDKSKNESESLRRENAGVCERSRLNRLPTESLWTSLRHIRPQRRVILLICGFDRNDLKACKLERGLIEIWRRSKDDASFVRRSSTTDYLQRTSTKIPTEQLVGLFGTLSLPFDFYLSPVQWCARTVPCATGARLNQPARCTAMWTSPGGLRIITGINWLQLEVKVSLNAERESAQSLVV